MIAISKIIIWSAYFISLYLLVFWLIVYLERGIRTYSRKLRYLPKVTVAIPAYNEESTIKSSINSVVDLDYPKDKLEIIVVNDGSKDKTKDITQEAIKEHSKSNIKLFNQENQGKGAALNTALKHASGEIFICLDADSVVKESTLKKILPQFEDNETAVVLPLMKVREKSTILEKLQWCEYLLNFFYKKLMGYVDCIHVAPGPFSAYKTSIIKKVGSFDEHNLTEDMEMSLRLQKSNYKIKQVLDAEVYTKAPSTFKGFYKQRNRWYKGTVLNMIKYRNMIFNKKYGDFGMLQMPFVASTGIIAIVIFSVILFDYILRPLFSYLYDLSFIGFDLGPGIKNFFSNFTLFDVNVTNIFFAIVAVTLGLVVIHLAYKHTNEKIFRKISLIAIPTYYLVYATLASIVWFGVFIELIFGKIQKW